MESNEFKAPLLPIGARKLLGTVIILVGLTAYTLGVVWLALEVLPNNRAVELVFYAVAGIAWAFPARPLINWMQRPDTPPEPR